MGVFIVTLLLSLRSALFGAIEAAARLPIDSPSMLGSVEAVCTGIGLDSRQNRDWELYPLKIEVAGQGGQYLGDITLVLSREGREVTTVRCAGPWILFRLPAGHYQVRAETEGKFAGLQVLVPATGQSRIVIRFPDLGGQTSPLTQ